MGFGNGANIALNYAAYSLLNG